MKEPLIHWNYAPSTSSLQAIHMNLLPPCSISPKIPSCISCNTHKHVSFILSYYLVTVPNKSKENLWTTQRRAASGSASENWFFRIQKGEEGRSWNSLIWGTHHSLASVTHQTSYVSVSPPKPPSPRITKPHHPRSMVILPPHSKLLPHPLPCFRSPVLYLQGGIVYDTLHTVHKIPPRSFLFLGGKGGRGESRKERMEGLNSQKKKQIWSWIKSTDSFHIKGGVGWEGSTTSSRIGAWNLFPPFQSPEQAFSLYSISRKWRSSRGRKKKNFYKSFRGGKGKRYQSLYNICSWIDFLGKGFVVGASSA